MKWPVIAGAAVLAAASLSAAPQQQQDADATGDITLRGCVAAGAERDAFVLTKVAETTAPGRSAMPATAHGRRVIFWLDDDEAIGTHVGKMVEVRGTLGEITESEIELKAGAHKDGGLLVEFEGPGRDVVASNSTIGDAVGTSGRTTPDKDDVKTFLIAVDVKDVTAVAGSCE